MSAVHHHREPAQLGGPLHEWNRWDRGWHGAFWILTGVAALWLLASPQLAAPQRWGGLAAVAAWMASYALIVQRRPWQVDRWTDVHLVISALVVGYACSIDGTLTLLLFLIYPQTWMLTRSLRSGTLATVTITALALAGVLYRNGSSPDSLRAALPQMFAGLLFSLFMGFWLTRIIQQSAERATLIAELEATRHELSEADRARGVMAERERVAREIHDTLAQGFTSIIMLSQTAAAGLARHPGAAADRLATIEDVARQNLAEARALVAAFSPVDLEGSTLPDAVRRLTARFGAETGLVVDVDLADGVRNLGRDREVVLLRAVQEALTNVRRHAAARRVVVRLVVDDAGARVEVGDDGVGFATDRAAKGYGLDGMRGRVSEVGGAMDVASVPGGGTRVTVSIPAAVPAVTRSPAAADEGEQS